MPTSCSAYNCTNRFAKGSGISFHRFPLSNKAKLNQWICSVRRKDFIPRRSSFLCSEHFTPDCFYKNHTSKTILKDDAVPTIFDFPQRLKKVLQTKRPSKQHNFEKVLPLQSVEDNIQSEKDNPEKRNFNHSTDHTYYSQDSLTKLKRCEAVVNKDLELNKQKKKLKNA